MNAPPAKATITSTTGPGQAVTALVVTDVTKFEVDFVANTMKVTRQGSNSSQVYDYSAMATLTWTITNGAAAIVVSS
jgi:hypothetical protein